MRHRREWSLQTACLSSNQVLFFMGFWIVRGSSVRVCRVGGLRDLARNPLTGPLEGCHRAASWHTQLLFHSVLPSMITGASLGRHSYMGFWGVWCNPVGSQTRTCEAFIRRPSFLCRALQPRTQQPHQDTVPLKDLAATQASFPRRVSSHCPF